MKAVIGLTAPFLGQHARLSDCHPCFHYSVRFCRLSRRRRVRVTKQTE
nr:MAG TPA: hypothetical protein [Caudoviricetes sp.]